MKTNSKAESKQYLKHTQNKIMIFNACEPNFRSKNQLVKNCIKPDRDHNLPK